MFTFLMTDIEGSTRLWEERPGAMKEALEKHNLLVTEAIRRHSGNIYLTAGDAFLAVFESPLDALQAAIGIQLALNQEAWEESGDLKVRIGLHVGEAKALESYTGTTMNRALMIQSAGHGRQTILSHIAYLHLQESNLPEIEFVDLGFHQLKDLQAPERLWQVTHPELPFEFPPLRTLSASSHNLPYQTSSFVGREQEISELKVLLTEAPLVTITGMGGTGKSRISIQLAADLLERFPDGVWFVELAQITDPQFVAQAVSKTLRLSEASEAGALAGDSLLKHLVDQIKRKKLLLILDNCEHLLDSVAKLTVAILRQCHDVRILANSREALAVGGERVYRLPSMQLPEPPPGGFHASSCPQPSKLMAFAGIRLFVERAEQVKQDFHLSEHNALDVINLCQRLDGIPLALELAAARVRGLSVEEITKRLDQRFRILTGGSRTALPRQQTLRALIDWSYDLLEDNQKALFKRLGVFSGGWTLEAAEAICPDGTLIQSWEILDLLMALVDKSLVIYEEKEGRPRYRLLESLKEYAQEKAAEQGEDLALLSRHRDYYFDFLTGLKPQMYGHEQSDTLKLIDIERDNLKRVIDFACYDEGSRPLGLQLAGLLAHYWRIRGYLLEGRQTIQSILQIEAGRTEDRAYALCGACTLAYIQGDYEEAQRIGEEALSIYQELDHTQGCAVALGNLANVANYMGRYELAKSFNEEALAIYRNLGNKRSVSITLNGLGNVMKMLGENAAAEKFYLESLSLRREMQDSLGIAITLSNLCDIALENRDYTRLETLNSESEVLYTEFADRRGLAIVYEYRSILAAHFGDHESAAAHRRQTLLKYRELGDKRGYVHYLSTSLRVALSLGKYELAAKLDGACEGLRLLIRYPLPPSLEGEATATRKILEESLSAPIYSRLFQEGASMQIEEALQHAESELEIALLRQ